VAISKPAPGATGWHTATDAAIDIINALDPNTDGVITADVMIDGTTNKVLSAANKTKLDGLSQGIPATTIDAKGDLLVGTAADTIARLAAGAEGQILTADPDETTGLLWATPASTSTVTHNTQTGSAYTLTISDAERVVEMNNASANTLTVPPNASVAFPIGSYLSVRQLGTGQTTIAAGSGVTIRSYLGYLKMAGQYAEGTLTKRGTNEWVLSGETAA
jgi:hypothetical protein